MPTLSANGVRHHYELVGPERGRPVVILHGAQVDARAYQPLASALAGELRVLLFDQRGIGRSEKPDEPYTTRGIADDTAALMDAVGFERAAVVGFSMGGAIAQWLAIDRPERVSRLVLACTLAGGPSAARGDGAALSAYAAGLPPGERARRLARAMFSDAFLAAHPELPVLLARQRREAPLDPTGFRRRMEAIAAHDTSGRLSEIRVPTLVLHGREDRIVPPANAEILAAGIPGARLNLTGGGHGFLAEGAEEIVAAIRGFLLEA